MQEMDIDIDKLEPLFDEHEGITSVLLRCYSEGAVLCLQRQGHISPKEGEIIGDWNETMSIYWEQKDQTSLEKAWDVIDAIECGATVIALSLVVIGTTRCKKGPRAACLAEEPVDLIIG